jgi:glycosyltransferase involved in cell wall biosynthesis
MSREISIVIPTYNEKKRIGKTLNELSDYIKNEKLDAEVLIIDAGSSTAAAREVQTCIPR